MTNYYKINLELEACLQNERIRNERRKYRRGVILGQLDALTAELRHQALQSETG